MRLLITLALLLPALARGQMMGFGTTADAGGTYPAVESGFPLLTNTSSTTNPKEITFSTAGASVLVLWVKTGSNPTIGVTGTTLTWTLRRTEGFTLQMYTAVSTGALTNEVVTATFTPASHGAVALYSVTNAGTTLTNHAGATGINGEVSVSLTSASSGSLLLYFTADPNSATPRTPRSDCTEYQDFLESNEGRDTSGQYTGNPTAGTYTLGTSDTSTAGKAQAIEIPPV